MADIQEIPLDNTEIPLDNENIQPEIQEENKEIEPEIQKETPVEEEIIPVKAPKPKGRGRPQGSKNLGPPKPRPKRKQPVVEETQVEEEYKENHYVPSSPKNKRISEAPEDVATIMLKMLQEQAYSRQARKQALYRSWFR